MITIAGHDGTHVRGAGQARSRQGGAGGYGGVGRGAVSTSPGVGRRGLHDGFECVRGQGTVRGRDSRRFRVVLPAFLAALLAVAAAPLEGQVLTGRLLAAFEDRPIPDGVVRFLSTDGAVAATAVSDEEGRFVLVAPGPGRYLVRGEAAFFEPLTEGPLGLEARDTVEVELRLLARAVVLDPLEVEVEGRSTYLAREGFHERARRGLGSFITREDIERAPAIFTSDILRRIPGVFVQSGLGGPKVYLRRRASFGGAGVCEPIVYIDNVPQRPSPYHPSPVDYLQPDQIAGIEVYNSQLRVPQAYASGVTGCGVILVWTRK